MDQASQVTFLSTLIPLIGVIIIISSGVIILNYNFRKNVHQRILEKEEMKSKHKDELLRWSIQIQEDERKRISNDMHDELGALLSISLMLCKKISVNQVYDSHHINNLIELLSSSLASTRRICYELLPPHLERYGLIAALESFRDQINSTNTIDFVLSYPTNFPRLPREIELGIFRIIAEQTTNTIKHAEGNVIRVSLCLESQFLTCYYSDNGKGLAEGLLTKGLGLKSIETRTSSLGGTFNIISQQPGFNSKVSIPND
ncbi:hypothetical protein SanaruYs_16580 [Chryseotalea sanaruensis]|uniref:histidine kinase n=1 Tax=Chryseotalea sanaruensis TaxID=2482724 RepID=A0A401U946_9BACT|nr:histidine kinase [Chryseotalea sanaruensis]GCC51433.1 hypothetical protein SanaruYs_16580 [Chryseotalea sanaruensis]